MKIFQNHPSDAAADQCPNRKAGQIRHRPNLTLEPFPNDNADPSALRFPIHQREVKGTNQAPLHLETAPPALHLPLVDRDVEQRLVLLVHPLGGMQDILDEHPVVREDQQS